MDKIPAYNALLNVRKMTQGETAWIDIMLKAGQSMDPSSPDAVYVAEHLNVIKTILETQDAIITMLMRTVDHQDDFLDEVKKKLNME